MELGTARRKGKGEETVGERATNPALMGGRAPDSDTPHQTLRRQFRQGARHYLAAVAWRASATVRGATSSREAAAFTARCGALPSSSSP